MMGISGLLKFVKDATDEIHIKKYAGQTVAVDTYCWIHRGSFACAEQLAKKENTDAYVKYCMKFINMLESYHVKPILVFDGCRLPSKELVEQERHKRRRENLERGKQLLREGKISAARDCFTKCVSVTPAMALKVMEAARARGVDCIVAPYEADAQLAFFCKSGLVEAVITEDSDLLCFGCHTVIFKLDLTGRAQEVTVSNFSRVKNLVGFTPDHFRYMCILSGCDYLPNIKGVGLAKACKALKLSKSKDGFQVAKKLHQYIRGISPVDESYGVGFDRANKTFLYQLVFDPRRRKLLPLNDYPSGLSGKEMEYAGPHMPDDSAFQIAVGNIDVNTKLVIGHFALEIWLQTRKPMDNLHSIWGEAVNKKTVSSHSNKVLKENHAVLPLPGKHISLSKDAVKDLPIDIVVGAVTSENSSKTNHNKLAVENRCNCNKRIDLEDMSDVLQSYSPSSVVKKKSEDNAKSPSTNKIVKSRFFASQSSLSSSKEFDTILETEHSSSSSALDLLEKSSAEDAVLNDILNEITTQEPLTKLSPVKRRLTRKTLPSKRQKVMENSWERLEHFSHRRKKKRRSVPVFKREFPSDMLNHNLEPKCNVEVISDEDIPLLDKENFFTCDDDTTTETKFPEIENFSQGANDSQLIENNSLQSDDVPLLDKSLTGESGLPMQYNCCSSPEIASKSEENLVCISSEEDQEERKETFKPRSRRLGLPSGGRFKSPVKLNLSKYFSQPKVSGLRKPGKRQKSLPNQPSITSFFAAS